ncbi:Tetratricopeptide repeat-like superfamily protein [Hibiscus syriacus]|uniref:Tetratricopeptide repeat-like superfamily protein n=1 Tax=Hibiscus syriacus TaxID=106335 RepID=A0A6A3CNY6_HIBSY|nr:Tetratricopeptide repeat-like superfamily protein [Hibiscus syriacus]
MNNLEESKGNNNPQHQQEEEMAASSAAMDGRAASALCSVLPRVHQAASVVVVNRSGSSISCKENPICVPNFAMVETVDDEKIANHLNRAVGNLERKPLRGLVQVNTSGEESKSGVEPSACAELAKHVSLNCSNLQFCGLMTIGMPDYTSTPENFKTLANCRSEVCKALGIPEEQCELSMGISGDF